MTPQRCAVASSDSLRSPFFMNSAIVIHRILPPVNVNPSASLTSHILRDDFFLFDFLPFFRLSSATALHFCASLLALPHFRLYSENVIRY